MDSKLKCESVFCGREFELFESDRTVGYAICPYCKRKNVLTYESMTEKQTYNSHTTNVSTSKSVSTSATSPAPTPVKSKPITLPKVQNAYYSPAQDIPVYRSLRELRNAVAILPIARPTPLPTVGPWRTPLFSAAVLPS